LEELTRMTGREQLLSDHVGQVGGGDAGAGALDEQVLFTKGVAGSAGGAEDE
jgi:hypothetical protein